MPTRDTPWPDGTPCWIDYGAADMEATKDFYSGLLGWEYTGGEPEFGGYLTATAARIREAGGTVVVEPMEVGPMGTMVIALDPQGNPFGLWQSGMHTGARIYNEPGSLAWNEAMADDSAAAREFYSAVFGFRFEPMGGEDMDYTTFSTGGNPLGGLGGRQGGSMPRGWLTCFSVEDTDQAVAAVEEKGGTVTVQPMDTPFGRFAVVADPWGAPFEVMGPAKG